MNVNKISFENLPMAVAQMRAELSEMKKLLEKEQVIIPTPPKIPIGIDKASQVTMLAKSTIYALARKREIPCYKNGKKLYFFEDELLDYITQGKRKTIEEINTEAEKDFNKRATRNSKYNPKK